MNNATENAVRPKASSMDPNRATAGGQMTSALVHTAGGVGANRTMGSVPSPIEAEKLGPRRFDPGPRAHVSRRELAVHEAAGGHLIAKHVGQSRAVLEARLRAEPKLNEVSTFASQAEAEAAMSSVMAQRSADIQEWVAKGAKRVRSFEGAFTGGSVLLRGAPATIVGSRALVVLQGDGRGDFIILTGYALP